MPELKFVYELPTVENVCNQVLREVISLPKVSIAHVSMSSGNASLLHQHSKMTEIYFILEGTGLLHYGESLLEVERDSYLTIPPNMPHKLQNVGNSDLEHLVFAIPPFNPDDVKLLDEPKSSRIPHTQKFRYDKPPITALDGALIYELISDEERKVLDVALAIGLLPPERKAIPHYHEISEEVYYIASGKGRVRVGDCDHKIRRGSVVHIPINTVHALENESKYEELRVLCVSSPAYKEGDFIFVKNA